MGIVGLANSAPILEPFLIEKVRIVDNVTGHGSRAGVKMTVTFWSNV